MLFLHMGLAQASEETPQENWIPDWLRSTGSWLETQQHSLSETVEESAQSIDAYLARDMFDHKLVNESYLKIQLRQGFLKGGEQTGQATIRAKLRLPNTKRKLKLTFDSDPDDFDSIANRRRDRGPGSNSPQAVQDTAIAGIRLDKYLGRKWDSHYGLGMKLKLPLNPYVRAGWTRQDHFGEHWYSDFLLRFSYFHTERWKAESNFNLYRPLRDNLLFQSASAIQYLDRDDNSELYQGLALHHRLSSDTEFSYQAGVSGFTNPSYKTDGYWLRTEMRKRLYKDWLFGKLVPDLFWGRSDSFRLSPSLLFELEIYFGRSPKSG